MARPREIPGLPDYLTDDTPKVECDRCGRKSWTKLAAGEPCGMPQPDRRICNGLFVLIEGAPAPTGGK